MIPLRIYASGFMCFRDEVELQFDGAPLWMLTGNNGAGKSAIFDAILYALYGTHRKGTQNAHFIINKESKNLIVEFDFAVGDDFFRVKRTLGRKGRPTFQAWESIGGRTCSREGMKLQEVSGTESKEGLKDWVTRIVGLDEKAFTASVFLRQGKGDALLTAEIEERHQILSQIVDLSKYQRLHERADEYRKTHKCQADTYQDQLRTVDSVDESAIEELSARIESAATVAETTRAQLDDLIALKVHAKNWNKLVAEQERLADEMEEAETLFRQSEQIEQNAARAAELNRALPLLQSLFQDSNRLAELEAQINSSNKAAAQLSQAHAEATVELRDVQANHDALDQELTTLRGAFEAAHETLSQLTPQLTEIELLQKARRQVALLDEQLAAFRPTLEAEVSDSEQHLKNINELRNTLPHLQHYRESRTAWYAARQQEESAASEIARLSKELNAASLKRDEAEGKLAEAQAVLANAERRKTESQLLFNQAHERLERLSQLDGHVACDWCGQPLTPQHLDAERLRLETELGTSESERDSALTSFEQAAEALELRLLAVREAGDKVAEIELLVERHRTRTSAAEQNKAQAEQQARVALNSLPAEYAGRLHWNGTQNVAQCFSIEYPSDNDLTQLQSHAARHQALEHQLAELRTQQSARHSYLLQRQAEVDNIASLEDRYPADQEAAVIASHASVTQELTRHKEALKKFERQLEGSRRRLTEARDRVNAASEQHQAAVREAEVAAARKQELSEIIRARRDELGDLWADAAQSLTDRKLQTLSDEAASLGNAPDKLKRLHVAYDQQAARKTRHAEVEAEMAAIDVRARRPLSELVSEEGDVQEQHQAANLLKREAETEKRVLEARRELRRDLEEKRLAHAQKAELYKQLATLLGRDKLQHELLRQAETSIVHNANNVLDRISGGTLRLELSKADPISSEGTTKGKGKGGAKALDLVAYHSSTRADALPVDFLSGSQRFRVAVSLALGIGQYASHGAQRIESVIIDEGFGSLDKQGCGEMIAELQRLKDVLGRIILVSHQEEVADAFPSNKYLVELVDGTSRVSLVEDLS